MNISEEQAFISVHLGSKLHFFSLFFSQLLILKMTPEQITVVGANEFNVIILPLKLDPIKELSNGMFILMIRAYQYPKLIDIIENPSE